VTFLYEKSAVLMLCLDITVLMQLKVFWIKDTEATLAKSPLNIVLYIGVSC
jgi:hypothetical protein